MSTQVQYRRGTEAQNNAFTGALAEITVDTTNWNLRIHDGVTPGGISLITANSTSTITNKTYQGVSLSVTGNVTGGNLVTGGQVSATGAINGAAITGTSLTVGSGNITAGNLILAGAIVDSAQLDIQTSAVNANIVLTPNGTGNVNIGRMSASGNITAVAFYGNGAALTSITGANVTGTVPSATSATTAGTVTTAAQPNITSVGTLTSLGVTGNITAGNLTGAALVSATNLTGTLTTAAQPNITSVGTLSTLTTTGNVVGGGITLSGNTIFSTGSTLTIDPSSPGSTGTVVIAGNLTVQGTTTTYDSTTVTINDLLFTVANNAATSSAANGGGLEVGPVGAAYATWTYDQPNSRWTTALGINATGNITGGNLSGTSIVGTLTTASQPNITSVGTLTSLSVSGNVTGANINGAHFGSGAGLSSLTGANVTGTVAAATSATTAGTVTTAAQGNITSVGTLTSLAVSGAITVNSTNGVTAIVNGGTSGVGNIGSPATTFNTVFARATTAQYADLAENYAADAEYEPGTVLVFGGSQEVTIATKVADPRVVGVVTTNPAYLMNTGLTGEHTVSIALIGRVPTKVIGPVVKGDFMVSAGAGYAQACATPTMGTVIGKAIQDFSGDKGVIEILINNQ